MHRVTSTLTLIVFVVHYEKKSHNLENFHDYSINLSITEKKKKLSLKFNKPFSQNASVHIKTRYKVVFACSSSCIFDEIFSKVQNWVPAISSTGNKIECSCNALVDALQKPQMWWCLHVLLLDQKKKKKKQQHLLPWQPESCTLQETE